MAKKEKNSISLILIISSILFAFFSWLEISLLAFKNFQHVCSSNGGEGCMVYFYQQTHYYQTVIYIATAIFLLSLVWIIFQFQSKKTLQTHI